MADNSTLDTIEKDIKEIEGFIVQSQRPNITRILKEQHTLLISALKAEKAKIEETSKNIEKPSFNNVDNSKNYVTISKYSFENSGKYAKVYFTDNFANIKDHPQDKVLAKFTDSSFELCVHDWNCRNFRFVCAALNKKINPSESNVKQTSSGLVVRLVKAKEEYWDGLEKKKSPLGDYSEDKAKSDDPSAGLMNMMKEMYQNGDDNTKRMIAESWQKSQEGKLGGMGKGGMPGGMGMGGMDDMDDMDFSKGMGGMGGMPDMSKMNDMMKNLDKLGKK